MKDLDFKTLKILAKFVQIDYDKLLSDLEIDDSISKERKFLSDSEYDNLQSFVYVLQEILKFRPLPF